MFPKDDIYTIPLPGSNLVFTRYLYLKDEVKISLLISILNKHTDAIFWGYELFYSGFQLELFELLWTIYYDFFATLNPSFEVYLLKKQKEVFMNTNTNTNTNNQESMTFISAIIQGLCIREYNTDIFKLRQITKLFEVVPEYTNKKVPETFKEVISQIKTWDKNKDYASIGYYILSHNTKFDLFEILLSLNVHKRILKGYSQIIKNSEDISRTKKISPKIIGLTKIFSHLTDNDITKINKYIRVVPHDIIIYDTITVDDGILPYRILQHACICGINDLKYLSLFHLERYTTKKIDEIYNRDWLYHASFSPVWKKRIQLYKGYIDYTNKSVEFINDDYLDAFYESFGYEPDEQPVWVKNRTIVDIDNIYNLNDFERIHGINNRVVIEPDILSELNMEKIVYL